MNCLWTAGFGDTFAEYWAVRRDVGMWDISSLVKFRFTGRDARTALDRLTTRRLIDAMPGVVRYGLVLDEKGAMLDEATLFVVSAEEAYLIGNDERAPFVRHLERHTVDLDVAITNVTATVPALAIQGPRSYELLSRLVGFDLASLKWYRLISEPVALAGASGLLARVGFTGELGYEFYLTGGAARAEALWDVVHGAGATPIGQDAIETLRVELGLLGQNRDYFPGATNPYDLSLDGFIDLDDHEFVGRSVCQKIAADPPRRFKALTVAGSTPLPANGTVVTYQGERVGVVRSAELSPRYGVLALAVLETPFAVEGRLVEVDGWPARIHPLRIDAQGRARSNPLMPARVDLGPPADQITCQTT